MTPRWKGPFRVKRVPNPYQVIYEDGLVWRTVHVNHTKPAKLTATDLPLPTPAPEPPRPAPGYLPRSLQRPCSRPPPPPLRAAATAGGDSLSPTREMPPPATAPTSQPPETAHHPRRSPRLHPELGQVCAIRSPPGNLAPRPKSSLRVTNTHPLVVSYNQCLGAKEDPCTFASLYLEDLRNGQAEQLDTMQQLTDALPKTEDPTSRFALSGHNARPDQPRLQHSIRAALWWMLPSDGEFRRASHSLQYYLARQGRRVVLRGGDVNQPKIYENRLFWIPDPTLPSEAYPKFPGCSPRRRRRKKKAVAAANENSTPLTADRPTQPTLSANRNSGHWASSKARQPMRSTPVEHSQSFTSFSLSQHPIPTANQNSESASRQDHSKIWGLYKPAQTYPRQDLTATHSRDNISGFGLSSPALQQPSTKPFSGLPAWRMTSPHRKAGEAVRERPGIVYPLLPRAARPDMRLLIDAALPEFAALDRSIQAAHGIGHWWNQPAGEPPATRTAFGQAPNP